MPAIHQVRSTAALRIVDLDRIKFNEAVADGFYRCAPATLKGSARVFEVEQLLPLYFFARLLEFGLPARRAGELACDAWAASRGQGAEESDRIILLRGRAGEIFVASAQGYPDGAVKHYDPEHEKPGRNDQFPDGMVYPAIGPVVFAVEFYFSHVRKLVAEGIAAEQRILGEEDE